MNMISRQLTFLLLSFVLQFSPMTIQAANTLDTLLFSLKTVKGKINSAKTKSNIDETVRLNVLNAYYAAEDNLDELMTVEQQIEIVQHQIKTLPVEIKKLERQIKKVENLLKQQKKENFALFPDDELEQRLIIEKTQLNNLMSSISRQEIQIAEQLKRPQQIREQITQIKNNQVAIQEEQSSFSTASLEKQELVARQLQLETLTRKLNASLAQLDLEVIVLPLREKSQKLELQLLNLQSKQLSNQIKGLDEFLVELRQQEIDDTQVKLIQAQKEATGKHLLIQEATKENIKYNLTIQETNKKNEKYLKLKNKLEIRHEQLEKDFKSAEQKINLAGLSPALGNLLREQRRNLPVAKTFQNDFDLIQKEIAFASLELYQLEEVKKVLVDLDQFISFKLSESVSEDIGEAEKVKIRTELSILLIYQQDLVLKLSADYSGYSRTLADVDFILNQLVTLADKFSLYLDQRLLWVRSAPMFDKTYLRQVYDSIVWFTKIKHWQATLMDLKQSIQNHPLIALLGIIIFANLLGFRKKIQLNLNQLLIKSSKPYVDRFSFTYLALEYIFLLILPLPFLFVWLGSLLYLADSPMAFSQSVAQGFFAAAVPLLLIQFFYYLLKPKGVVQTMFYWKDHSTQLFYSQFKWLRFVIVPAVFMVAFFVDDTYSEHNFSLGRLALIITMLSIALFIHNCAHPVKGLATLRYQEKPRHWVSRFRYIWYGILIVIPLIIIGFAVMGYYQSALELQEKLIFLLRMIFFTTLFHELIIRAMFLANRQLALQNARNKRKHQEDQGENSSTNNLEEEILLDIPKINEQSKKLLNALVIMILLTGSWFTLRDIFPAFSIFDQVVLWKHLVLIDGKEVQQSITLVTLFLCLIYLILMMVFVNNFPGLIDLLFVGRYKMVAGSRYALIQLTRYAIIAITFISIANNLGGSWTQVQWLVAAISVGLGFGLQEIFANMVSGIILLFERPIRVGDTVTVGDVHGKVCRIKMRATTILDWDNKELIVPNKMFITDKLINWSLSDTTTRIVISVGIAYHSDSELAQQIIRDVIEETPKVLKEPEPSVYFMGFGESSLDFSLRMFVRELDDRLPVTDDIHKRIRLAFQEHKIEIPFPQRDLHIISN